jgi:thioredoxin-like negative regulator of GroEL
MLNPMSTAEVVRAVGAVLEASAAGGADDDYRRGQVLSAFSVCRHLAAEEAGRRELAEWLEAASAPALAGLGEAPLSAAQPEEAGERLAALMEELRDAGDEDSREALAELRAVMRELCDREIAILVAAD